VQLIGLLFIAGALVIIAKWLLIIAAIVAPFWLLQRGLNAWIAADQRRERELDAIRARADQQNEWVWVGDPRGIYGAYPPAV
jgi:hypothetical protein